MAQHRDPLKWRDQDDLARRRRRERRLGAADFDDQPIYLGSDIDSGAFSAPFGGLVDDVRIYNPPLLPDELAALAGQ